MWNIFNQINNLHIRYDQMFFKKTTTRFEFIPCTCFLLSKLQICDIIPIFIYYINQHLHNTNASFQINMTILYDYTVLLLLESFQTCCEFLYAHPSPFLSRYLIWLATRSTITRGAFFLIYHNPNMTNWYIDAHLCVIISI